MAENIASCPQLSVIEDASLRDTLWDVYCQAFAGAADECIQDQLCYSRQAFDAALMDPDYLKFVAMDGGDVAGFILCTNNLDKARIAYVNPGRLRRQYPQYAGRIYYYTAIAVRPTRQGKRFALLLIETAGAVMDKADALIVFDYSEEKNPALPDLIARGLRAAQAKSGDWNSDGVDFVALGGQKYGALVLKKG